MSKRSMIDFNLYKDYIVNISGLKGVNDYTSRFRLFTSYLNGRPFTYENCLRVKQELKKDDYSPSSVNNVIKIIKKICDCMDLYNLPYDEKIRNVPYEKKEIIHEKETFTEDEIKRIAKTSIQFSQGGFQLNSRKNAKRNLRYKVLVYLLACGARIDELATLPWDRVWEDRILVDGKTGKRVMSIPKKLYKIMLLLDRHPHNLVLGSARGMLYDHHANVILRQKVAAAHIQKYLTSHCFRHSYIMNNILAGESIAIIAQQVGHKSWDTTRQYSHLTHVHTKKQVEGYKVFRDKRVDDKKELLKGKIDKMNDPVKLQAILSLIQ